MIIESIHAWDEDFISSFVNFKNSIYVHHKDYIFEEISEFQAMLKADAPFNFHNKWQAFLIRNESDQKITGRVFCSTRTDQFKQKEFLPFGYFEALNLEVAEKLITLVEEFAKNEGYDYIRGPIQGNVFNSSRWIIKQERRPFLTEPVQRKKYIGYLSKIGFKQNEFWISTEYGFWDRLKSIKDVFITKKAKKFKQNNYHFRQLDKENWDTECIIFYDLLMDSFREMKDVEQVTYEEFKVWIDRLKPLINPKNCLILQHHGVDAAFICAISDVRAEIAKLAKSNSWWQKLKYLLKYKYSFGRILVLYLGKKSDLGGEIPKAGPALCKELAKNNYYFLFNNLIFGYMNQNSKSLAVSPDHFQVISEYATYEKKIIS